MGGRERARARRVAGELVERADEFLPLVLRQLGAQRVRDGYFELASLKQLTQELIDEQNKGERLMMLIKIQDKIIGRANFQVIRGDYAEIGYRVAKSHSGQGVASWVVSELIAVAQQELSISKLIAKVTTENIASQQVLTKQGFIHAKTERSAVELNGRSHDLFVYEWLDLGLSPVLP